MLVEIDEIAVPKDLLVKVRSGDEAAVERLRLMLDVLVLYFHNLSEDPGKEPEDYELLTIRQLWELVGPGERLIASVKLEAARCFRGSR